MTGSKRSMKYLPVWLLGVGIVMAPITLGTHGGSHLDNADNDPLSGGGGPTPSYDFTAYYFIEPESLDLIQEGELTQVIDCVGEWSHAVATHIVLSTAKGQGYAIDYDNLRVRAFHQENTIRETHTVECLQGEAVEVAGPQKPATSCGELWEEDGWVLWDETERMRASGSPSRFDFPPNQDLTAYNQICLRYVPVPNGIPFTGRLQLVAESPGVTSCWTLQRNVYAGFTSAAGSDLFGPLPDPCEDGSLDDHTSASVFVRTVPLYVPRYDLPADKLNGIGEWQAKIYVRG